MKYKKNEKGFTLIELLAVIVILGLLMAIAIPSVTKYITESRVKTLVSTVDSYVRSVSNQVNDGDYRFSDSTKVFAIPIECVSLEKGGTNPFGEWMQANDNYWAYVLVQYDSENYNYEYGFTFKDSAGYGMYPTKSDKITNSMIRTGYDDLKQPKDGFALNFVSSDKWEGFNITSDTELIVLEATSEGDVGDGIDTCTLCQKGDNYDDVEQEKAIAREEAIKNKTLIVRDNNVAFWQYRDKISSVTFEDSINIPTEIPEEHKWDVSLTGKGLLMAYIKPSENNNNFYDLYIQGDGIIYANPNSSNLFNQFNYVNSVNNINILNTSRVTNMYRMFGGIGQYSYSLKLDLGDNFDTSNVTDMAWMFAHVGAYSKVFTLDLGDNFDTSNVTNMNNMFMGIASFSEVYTLDLGDKFDTSKVTDMSYMFSFNGRSSSNFTIDLGDKFDTSNVTNMSYMFNKIGGVNPAFKLDLGNKFDTSKVINMESMFASAGYSNDSFKLDCSNWDVANVKNYGNFNANVETKIISPKWVK